MAQRAKFIDLTRTFLPIDPNSLPETMHGTEGEDRPEQRIPVVPYEGWNFMPTGQGWRSYFGLTATLGIDALATPARCRDIFVFQREDLKNVLIALCDDGIWTKAGESSGAWTHAVTLTDPNDGTLLEWSRCIIENVLYIYRQAGAKVYSYQATAYTWAENVPTTLNMSGQLGIFKAGGRLGVWDSADSVGFSAFVNRIDFTPDIGTQANITKIVSLVGKIIVILQHGDGFIVYGTKSIIGIVKNSDNTFLWKSVDVSTIAGVAYRGQVAVGSPDTVHFAWTSIGLFRIENFKAEVITPELYDYLREGQDPIYLKMLEGRYLFLQLSSLDYVNGIITFYTGTSEPITVTLTEARAAVAAQPDPVTISVWGSAAAQNSFYNALSRYPADSALSPPCGGPGYCTGVDYGHYVDNFRIPIVAATVTEALTELEGNKLANPVFTSGSYVYGATTRYMVASKMPISDYSSDLQGDFPFNPMTLEEDNEFNFFDKCRIMWDNYNAAALNYIATVEAQHPDGVYAVTSVADNIELVITHGYEYEFGKKGYTYYCEARPRKVYTKTIVTTTIEVDISHIDYNTATYCELGPIISYSHPDYFFRYLLDGSTVASPNTPPTYAESNITIAEDLCARGYGARAKPALGSIGTTGTLSRFDTSFTIGGVGFSSVAAPAETFTYPPVSFLMQTGAAAPYNLEWQGAFVYDTHFKRWGKQKGAYRQLLDFSPINSTAVNVIPYTHFSVNGALLNSAGEIKVFDANPTDSYLKFGKIGNFRFGFTTLEEIRADFRRLCTGSFEVETSLDGLSVDSGLTKTYTYTIARQLLQGVGSAGRWHNLAVRGQFDLTYLEFRAWTSSRR